MKKFAFNVLSSATLLATAAVPVVATVAPIAASAATDSRVGEVPTFSNDADSAQLATLTFKEDTDYKTDLTAGGTITLTYPNGAKLNSAPTVTLNTTVLNSTYVQKTGDYTVTITIPDSAHGLNGTGQDALTIDSNVQLDGYSGSTVDVDVQSLGAGVPSGKYTLARVAQGSTVTTALDNVTVGEDGGSLGAIRIEESSVATIKDGDKITLKLPKGINWSSDTVSSDVYFLGGLAGNFEVKSSTFQKDDNTLTFYVHQLHAPSTRGFIQITPKVDVDKDTAKTGDITADVSGTNVDSADVVVGSYSDYQAGVKVDGDVPTIFSGRYDANDKTRDEQKLAKLNISEAVLDSIIDSRTTTVKLPAGVKVIAAKVSNAKGINTNTLQTAIDNAISSASNDTESKQEKLEFIIPRDGGSSKVDFDLQLYVSAKAGFTGDITADVSGRSGVTGSAVIGKVVSPVTLSSTSQKVVIGKKDQKVGDITITEGAAGAILDDKDSDGVLKVQLPDDVSWNNLGTVEVTSGDLEIDTKNIDTASTTNGTDNILLIPIKSESTKASTIKISGATIDVDRSVPEGSIVAKVKGLPVVQNSSNDDDTFATFDASTIASGEVANVATPAPGTTYANASFTIGKTTYTVNGVEKTLDVAPYTKAGRTYLPVRFVAEAVGVSSDSIIWDDASKTVTIIKDGRVAKFTVGKSSYVLNGVTVNMDAAPEFVQNRNMLPLRYVAQSLGVQVNWDDATQTVSLQ